MKFYMVVLSILLSMGAYAQINHVSLTASGLTCSMCSKAIYTALSKLSSVEKVDVDIEKSVYILYFKPNARIDIGAYKKAVVDAGFSVSTLSVTARFNKEPVGPDTPLSLDGNPIVFIGGGAQVLDGEKTLLVVDKGYLNDKERRAYEPLLRGAAGAGAGVAGGGKNYHVVLQKS